MSNQRPDPEALLKRLQAEEAKQARGKLKVYVLTLNLALYRHVKENHSHDHPRNHQSTVPGLT